MRFYTVTRAVNRAMRHRGWTKTPMDNTVRSRIAHAIGDWTRWYDWGHPVMWLVGRYHGGSAGVPRGRDMWWIPTEYVEGVAASLVADFEQRYGCYTTTRYEDVRATSGDIEWRVYDLQDDGRTVKVGLWPNSPEHKGRIQPLPWQELETPLFLWWYLVQHKGRAQWFGVRPWVYYKALSWAVGAHSPFACGRVPDKGSGGYSHWHCDLRKRHGGPHRYRSYTWGGPGAKVQFAPLVTTPPAVYASDEDRP